ncbi:MAG: peptidoglycan-binding protein LysM, partial [Rothia mucilaginosa]
MDHLSTPGQAPAAFASHPLASVASLASGADAGHETSTKASYQDALLFIAPPLLSAAVLGALSVNLHRIPSAHPLADASLLCA